MMESNGGFTRHPPQPKVVVSVLLEKAEADAEALLTLAARLGVAPSSVRKVLEGRSVSDYLQKKTPSPCAARRPGRAGGV